MIHINLSFDPKFFSASLSLAMGESIFSAMIARMDPTKVLVPQQYAYKSYDSWQRATVKARGELLDKLFSFTDIRIYAREAVEVLEDDHTNAWASQVDALAWQALTTGEDNELFLRVLCDAVDLPYNDFVEEAFTMGMDVAAEGTILESYEDIWHLLENEVDDFHGTLISPEGEASFRLGLLWWKLWHFAHNQSV